MSAIGSTAKGDEDTHVLQNLRARLVFGSLGLVHPVANTNELPVDIFETRGDRVCDGLLELFLHETSREWAQGLVQDVVLRVANRELEGSNLDIDVLHLENARAVFVCGDDMGSDSQTLATEQDVGQARVGEFRETALLLEVERNVAHVRLDLAQRENELVVILIPEDARVSMQTAKRH